MLSKILFVEDLIKLAKNSKFPWRSRPKIYEKIHDGTIPAKCIKMGVNHSYWFLEDEILNWSKEYYKQNEE